MGTRCGSIDPGIILWLIAECGLPVADVQEGLNKRSGLSGISGVGPDTRDVTAAQLRGDERAGLAIAMYVHRLRLGLGSMFAALNGIDAVAFTGPVGEHMPNLRAAICTGLEYAGLHLDEVRNAAAVADAALHLPSSLAGIYVIRTLEEWAVAAEAARSISASAV
jgi:acetate kinase